VSESNEEQNDFEDVPAVETPAEETAPTAQPEPSAVHEGVKKAIAEQAAKQIQLAPCPCGSPESNLMLDVPQGSKIGRASCGACGVWGVDFLVPRVQDQELVGKYAAKAWNEAPRAV